LNNPDSINSLKIKEENLKSIIWADGNEIRGIIKKIISRMVVRTVHNKTN